MKDILKMMLERYSINDYLYIRTLFVNTPDETIVTDVLEEVRDKYIFNFYKQVKDKYPEIEVTKKSLIYNFGIFKLKSKKEDIAKNAITMKNIRIDFLKYCLEKESKIIINQ